MIILGCCENSAELLQSKHIPISWYGYQHMIIHKHSWIHYVGARSIMWQRETPSRLLPLPRGTCLIKFWITGEITSFFDKE